MTKGLNCDLFPFVRDTLKARSGLDAFFLLSTPRYARKIYENKTAHAYAEKIVEHTKAF
jgi:TFIIF-interacting CTD phosphatase-like protein